MKNKLKSTAIFIISAALIAFIIGWNASNTERSTPAPKQQEQAQTPDPLVQIPVSEPVSLPPRFPAPSEIAPAIGLTLAQQLELELQKAEETAEEWWEKRAIQEQQLQVHIDRRNRGEVETEAPDEELDALMENMGLTELHGNGWGGMSMHPRSDEVLEQAKALDPNIQHDFAQEIELLEKMATLRNALEQERATLNESGGTEHKDASRRFYQMQAREIKTLLYSPEIAKLREHIIERSRQTAR